MRDEATKAVTAIGLALRCADEALLLVVTHGIGGDPDRFGELTDVHGGGGRQGRAMGA